MVTHTKVMVVTITIVSHRVILYEYGRKKESMMIGHNCEQNQTHGCKSLINSDLSQIHHIKSGITLMLRESVYYRVCMVNTILADRAILTCIKMLSCSGVIPCWASTSGGSC